MKADSEATAITSSSVSNALDMCMDSEDEERMTWGGRFSIILHYILDFW